MSSPVVTAASRSMRTRITLTIGARKGTFNGMLKNRKFNIILVSPTHAQGLDIDHTVAGKVVKYSGSRVVVKL